MADNDGKIYITISDRRFGRNKAEADEQNKQEKEDKKEQTLKDFVSHKFFNMIESQAKQAVNYTISNIGNFTGDYIKQAQVSNAVQIINFGIELGTAALAGSKFGAPGAIAAVAIVATGKLINTGEQLYSQYIENTKQNRDIAQLRTRAGLNSSNNNSRGTEY